MSGIKIYTWNTTTLVYNLTYTLDNCETLEISKSAVVSLFPLPIVETDEDTTNRLILEKIEVFRISGIEATTKLNWEAAVSDRATLLALATNRIGSKHKIVVEDWGVTSNTLVGLIGSVVLRQSGGNVTKMKCELTFFEGDSVFFDLGF